MRPVPITACSLLLAAIACGGDAHTTIVVGSKNFTEQVIVGEIVAALIEGRTDLAVDRRLNLGGTFVCHKALVAGELDLYVEYTGTALSAILAGPPPADPEAVFGIVKEAYAARFGLSWLPPLGFANTFALVVRPEDAADHRLRRVSDLVAVAGTFRAGFGYEFMERADGYRGLAAAYGLELKEPPREMDLGLIYRALDEHEVDFVVGNSTDGLIDALGLVVLEDDRRYFPPYDAAPVVRDGTLERHPELRPLLEELAGSISEQQMRRMNHAVDGEHRAPDEVAREFLLRARLIDS